MVVQVTGIETTALDIMGGYVGSIVARSILQGAITASGINPATITPTQTARFLHALESGIRVFVADPVMADECCQRLGDALSSDEETAARTGDSDSLTVEVTGEYDVVMARGRAREMCAKIGFAQSEQVKVATVASELARNIVQYAGSGRLEFHAVSGSRSGIEVQAIDEGLGIHNINEILSGEYKSRTGMGMGLVGAKRLMDDFSIETASGKGTHVTARKYLL